MVNSLFFFWSKMQFWDLGVSHNKNYTILNKNFIGVSIKGERWTLFLFLFVYFLLLYFYLNLFEIVNNKIIKKYKEEKMMKKNTCFNFYTRCYFKVFNPLGHPAKKNLISFLLFFQNI